MTDFTRTGTLLLALTTLLVACPSSYYTFTISNRSEGSAKTPCAQGLQVQLKVGERVFESSKLAAEEQQNWGSLGTGAFPGLDLSTFTVGSTVTVTAFCYAGSVIGQSRASAVKSNGAPVTITVLPPGSNIQDNAEIVVSPGPTILLGLN